MNNKLTKTGLKKTSMNCFLLQTCVDHHHDQSSTSLKKLREAIKTYPETARKQTNEFWSKASARIQAATDQGDTKLVYEGTRKAVRPTKKLASPLQSESREILHSRN